MKVHLSIATALLCLLTASCQEKSDPEGNSEKPKEPVENTFVIIGDSYSTFSGHIPSEYLTWYPNADNDVKKASQTWWGILDSKPEYKLIYNSSYSGSTICNTGYNNSNSVLTSFVTRMKQDIMRADGNAGRCREIPDVVLIFGGTNDSWANSPLGEVLPKEKWRSADLKKCFPATCYMAAFLREKLPHSRIILMVNPGLKNEFNTEFPKIAEEYGIECILLKDVDKQANHPSREGMVSIAEQMYDFLQTE